MVGRFRSRLLPLPAKLVGRSIDSVLAKSSSATQVEEEEKEAKESFKPIRIQNSCVATSLHLSLSASLIKRIQRSLNE